MAKRPIKDMPIVPPADGEIQRRNVYTRVNPKGDYETVVKRRGTTDEETLNELARDILSLIESVEFGGMPALSPEQPDYQRTVNQQSPPQLVASRGDPARATGDTLTNMTVAAPVGRNLGPLPSDSPELSRSKSKLSAISLGNSPNSKSINGYNNGAVDGATQIESFTGTGSIALIPNALPSTKKKKRSASGNTTRSENSMSNRRTIKEWLPGFKGNGYTPGEYQMPSPGGKGVADRTPTQDKVGSYDTDTSNAGKEWPREHNDTAAMCDVDDDGVEHEPQGSHESTHGEANDGHQSKVGHDWPAQPKNKGQGVAEPFGGSRWSDGGTLEGRGPGADTWTHEEGPGMPSDGEITGTSGSQLGQPTNEDWTPSNMANLMGEEINLQALFDSYARSANAVCVEDFQQLCDAHGAEVELDTTSLLRLMSNNKEYMFFEGSDTNGSYWVAESLSECNQPRRKKKQVQKESKNVLSELQVRSPEDEAGLFNSGDPYDNNYLDVMGRPLPNEPEALGVGGPEEFGAACPGGVCAPEIGGQLECPGCGYVGEDEACPECGTEMMDVSGGLDDPESFHGGGLGGEERLMSSPAMENREVVTGPRIVESLRNFMTSAKALIEQNPKAMPRDLAEALNHSWAFYASKVNANTCPANVQHTLRGLMTKYPGFTPTVLENDAMCPPEGSKLCGGDGPKVNLPSPATTMKARGDKSLLGKSQTNDLAGTPTIAGTGKKLTGTSTESVGLATQAAQANITKLGTYIKKAIKEHAKAFGHGKFNLEFSVLIKEAKKLPDFIKKKSEKKGKDKDKPAFLKNRTKKRDNLAEALADVEEILQIHKPEDVTFEATFLGLNGQIAMKQDIPLFTIAPRGPMVGEGKALFRFQRNAEAFADNLVSEGITCKILPHNWGSAVEARTNYETALKAFRSI